MAKKLKVFLPETNQLVESMFIKHKHKIVDTVKKADIVVFTGGADIDPALYGQHQHSTAQVYEGSIKRDKEESAVFEEAQDLNKYCIGICRGAQLLNVLNGGQMWQDVDNHAIGRKGHRLYDVVSDKFIQVSSTHHQMMIPHKSAEIIATANEASILGTCNNIVAAKQTVEVQPTEGWTDIEVLLYDNTSSLCFQPHPEYGPAACENYFFELLGLCITN